MTFLVTGRYKHCDYRWTSFFQHCVVFVYTQKWGGQTLQSLYVYEFDQNPCTLWETFPQKDISWFDLAKNIKRIYLVAL